ncbi:hypothetical protein [Neptuniibacter sp.]|uniref:hypothetical protein n=1 Tax=Neptuniibacter sp. TaxID=1962643 RepID=UPI002611D6A0|nr:hypothetical protein [Neptuniibacter sp.]MCP4596768.1 hypothetical protein [Neptuniibacter sp.]
MTRLRKSRKAKGFIDNEGPSRNERLADPNSYESRRRKAQEKKKKHTSVYEKERQAEKNNASDDKTTERKTRLADKIKKLNKEKQKEQD